MTASREKEALSRLPAANLGEACIHIFAARALKNMSQIPADFAADDYWHGNSSRSRSMKTVVP